MKITSTADLGKVIRSKRKKLGYTQAQLSEYTGFSTSFISDLENGKKQQSLEEHCFAAVVRSGSDDQ